MGDSALIGVVIGSSLSLFGNLVTHWLTNSKETKQWERQRQSEEDKRKREDEERARAFALDLYINCISRLGVVIAAKSGTFEMQPQDKAKLHEETIKSLASLALYRGDLYKERQSGFQDHVQNFAESPESYADIILDEVKQMAMYDTGLFPGRARTPKTDGVRKVQVNVEDEFRRQSVILGKELPKHHMFECDLYKLKPSQREKLWDMHGRSMPSIIYLSVPALDQRTKKVVLKGPAIWEASLDPTSISAEAIFDVWEAAFEEALAKARKATEQDTTSSAPGQTV